MSRRRVRRIVPLVSLILAILGVWLSPLLGEQQVAAQGGPCPASMEGRQQQWQISPSMMGVFQCTCTRSLVGKRCEWRQISQYRLPPTATGAAPTWTPTRKPTNTPTPATRPASPTPALMGAGALLIDFETFGAWKRGDEPYGTFVQAGDQAAGGKFSAKLTYNFPANVQGNYVVFRRTVPIKGAVDALRVMVLGDGSGHFLNAWIQDAKGQLWQFTFGQVNHTGWQPMIAALDLNRGWPNVKIGNASTAAPIAPLKFYAFLLDGYTSDRAFQGTIYLDTLSALKY